MYWGEAVRAVQESSARRADHLHWTPFSQPSSLYLVDLKSSRDGMRRDNPDYTNTIDPYYFCRLKLIANHGSALYEDDIMF